MRRERIVLRLPADAGAPVQWRRFDETASVIVGQGSLEELAADIGNTPVQALIPGEQVFVTRVNIPTQNRQRLRKAIPFALEDQLLDEVETLHFALGQRRGDSIEVAVVARRLLDGWLERLRQAGLVVERLLPDVYALAPQADCWVALWEDTRLLLRPSRAAPLVLDNDSLGELLPLVLDEAGDDRPERICLWDARDGAVGSLPLDGVELERRSSEGLLQCLSVEGLPADAIDLLQGDYSRREQLGKLWRPWRLTAVLALVVFGLQVAATAYDNSRLRQQSQALRAQVETVYRQAFPEARKVVNPRVQMQRKLDELRAGGDGQGMLELLARSGKVLRNKRGLVLRSIRYKQGELDLEVEVASLQQLDELKQQLTREAGMQVDIQSAAAKGSKVRGRLRLKGDSS